MTAKVAGVGHSGAMAPPGMQGVPTEFISLDYAVIAG